MSSSDHVVYLDIDEVTLRDRIAGRAGNDYGKSPYELHRILEQRRVLDRQCVKTTQRLLTPMAAQEDRRRHIEQCR